MANTSQVVPSNQAPDLMIKPIEARGDGHNPIAQYLEIAALDNNKALLAELTEEQIDRHTARVTALSTKALDVLGICPTLNEFDVIETPAIPYVLQTAPQLTGYVALRGLPIEWEGEDAPIPTITVAGTEMHINDIAVVVGAGSKDFPKHPTKKLLSLTFHEPQIYCHNPLNRDEAYPALNRDLNFLYILLEKMQERYKPLAPKPPTAAE